MIPSATTAAAARDQFLHSCLVALVAHVTSPPSYGLHIDFRLPIVLTSSSMQTTTITVTHPSDSVPSVVPPASRLIGIELNPGPPTGSSSSSSISTSSSSSTAATTAAQDLFDDGLLTIFSYLYLVDIAVSILPVCHHWKQTALRERSRCVQYLSKSKSFLPSTSSLRYHISSMEKRGRTSSANVLYHLSTLPSLASYKAQVVEPMNLLRAGFEMIKSRWWPPWKRKQAIITTPPIIISSTLRFLTLEQFVPLRVFQELVDAIALGVPSLYSLHLQGISHYCNFIAFKRHQQLRIVKVRFPLFDRDRCTQEDITLRLRELSHIPHLEQLMSLADLHRFIDICTQGNITFPSLHTFLEGIQLARNDHQEERLLIHLQRIAPQLAHLFPDRWCLIDLKALRHLPHLRSIALFASVYVPPPQGDLMMAETQLINTLIASCPHLTHLHLNWTIVRRARIILPASWSTLFSGCIHLTSLSFSETQYLSNAPPLQDDDPPLFDLLLPHAKQIQCLRLNTCFPQYELEILTKHFTKIRRLILHGPMFYKIAPHPKDSAILVGWLMLHDDIVECFSSSEIMPELEYLEIKPIETKFQPQWCALDMIEVPAVAYQPWCIRGGEDEEMRSMPFIYERNSSSRRYCARRNYRQKQQQQHQHQHQHPQRQQQQSEQVVAPPLVGVELNPGPEMKMNLNLSMNLLFNDGVHSIFAFLTISEWNFMLCTSKRYYTIAQTNEPSRKISLRPCLESASTSGSHTPSPSGQRQLEKDLLTAAVGSSRISLLCSSSLRRHVACFVHEQNSAGKQVMFHLNVKEICIALHQLSHLDAMEVEVQRMETDESDSSSDEWNTSNDEEEEEAEGGDRTDSDETTVCSRRFVLPFAISSTDPPSRLKRLILMNEYPIYWIESVSEPIQQLLPRLPLLTPYLTDLTIVSFGLLSLNLTPLTTMNQLRRLYLSATFSDKRMENEGQKLMDQVMRQLSLLSSVSFNHHLTSLSYIIPSTLQSRLFDHPPWQQQLSLHLPSMHEIGQLTFADSAKSVDQMRRLHHQMPNLTVLNLHYISITGISEIHRFHHLQSLAIGFLSDADYQQLDEDDSYCEALRRGLVPALTQTKMKTTDEFTKLTTNSISTFSSFSLTHLRLPRTCVLSKDELTLVLNAHPLLTSLIVPIYILRGRGETDETHSLDVLLSLDSTTISQRIQQLQLRAGQMNQLELNELIHRFSSLRRLIMSNVRGDFTFSDLIAIFSSHHVLPQLEYLSLQFHDWGSQVNDASNHFVWDKKRHGEKDQYGKEYRVAAANTTAIPCIHNR